MNILYPFSTSHHRCTFCDDYTLSKSGGITELAYGLTARRPLPVWPGFLPAKVTVLAAKVTVTSSGNLTTHGDSFLENLKPTSDFQHRKYNGFQGD